MTTHAITQHWLEGPYGPIRYWESTPRIGRPILLVHGYGAMIEHWRQVMRPIARKHHLLAVDLYYFGESAIPTVAPSRKIWAEQLAAFVRHINNGPVVVVGHSMGGIASLQFSHDFPDLVAGLVLVNSVGLDDPTRRQSAFDQLFFQMATVNGVGEMIAAFAANPWAARQGLLNAYHRKACVTDELVTQFTKPLRRPGGARGYLAVTRSFPQLFLDLKHGSVKQPTLLLWGEEDQSVPLRLAEMFRERLLPQAELATIPDSGHCPFDETPDEFVKILLPWVNRLP